MRIHIDTRASAHSFACFFTYDHEAKSPRNRGKLTAKDRETASHQTDTTQPASLIISSTSSDENAALIILDSSV